MYRWLILYQSYRNVTFVSHEFSSESFGGTIHVTQVRTPCTCFPLFPKKETHVCATLFTRNYGIRILQINRIYISKCRTKLGFVLLNEYRYPCLYTLRSSHVECASHQLKHSCFCGNSYLSFSKPFSGMYL